MSNNNETHLKDLWDTIVNINSCINSKEMNWESVLKLFENSANKAGVEDDETGTLTPEDAVRVLNTFSESLENLEDNLLDKMCKQELRPKKIYDIASNERLYSLERTLWKETA